MEERPNDLFDLLKDRALGGAGTIDAKDCNPRADDPNGCNRGGSEFTAYLQARRENAAIAEARRKRKTGTSPKLGGNRTRAGERRDGEEVAADEEPGMTIDEAVAIFLGSLGMVRDATEERGCVTRAAG